MPINIFPQLQINPTSGRSGPVQIGVSNALTLEKLEEARRNNKLESDKLAARDESLEAKPVTAKTESGLTVNMGETLELNPEKYAENLAKVSPEAANTYRKSLLDIEDTKTKLASSKLDLEAKEKAQPLRLELISQEALTRSWDYLKATKDVKGAITLANTYASPDDQIQDMQELSNGNWKVTQMDGDVLEVNDRNMMLLGRDKEENMKTWASLYGVDAATERAKTKESKPKTPKKAGPTDLKAAHDYISSVPMFADMETEQLKTLRTDIANGILDAQQKAANEGEQPPSYDEARETVVSQLMSRIVPAEKVNWGFDKPAQYFTSPEAVLESAKKKKITKTEAERILQQGFPEWYKKKQEELTKK